MNKSNFIAFLEQPNQIDSTNIENIQSLVQEFPYFQSAQLLLTKAFLTSENFNFEQQLRKTAAYAANRKVLHELLFSESRITEKIEEPKDITHEIETTETISSVESITEKEIFDSVEEISDSEKAIEELHTENIVSLDNAFSSQEETSENLNEDALERQILTSAINSSILLEVSDEIDLENLPEKKETKESSSINLASEQSANSFDESTSHSFSGWLSHFKDEEAEKPVWESEKEVHKVKTIVSENNQLPEKHEFYSPAKMARLSVQDNDDLITETLANIYADQGNFEKAIKSFEKLQLKYPEKKIYFAGRIKEIENQLNTL